MKLMVHLFIHSPVLLMDCYRKKTTHFLFFFPTYSQVMLGDSQRLERKIDSLYFIPLKRGMCKPAVKAGSPRDLPLFTGFYHACSLSLSHLTWHANRKIHT